MLPIAIDIMGGDYAPKSNLEGVEAALKNYRDIHLFLVGDEAIISSYLEKKEVDFSRIKIIHTTQKIEMGDDPLRVLSEKKDASLVRCFEMLAEGSVVAMASAGHSGVMMSATHFILKVIEGVSRPCVASILPSLDEYPGLILDAGVNIDCKPEFLVEFARLGTIYQKHVEEIPDPKVALINIGEEPSKGNKLAKEAYELLKDSKDIHFFGNIEGRDLFRTKKYQVMVCDGFVGNIILKFAESLYSIFSKKLDISHEFVQKMNYEFYGGAPILGSKHNVILGHGISNGRAVCNMIGQARKMAKVNLSKIIIESFR